MGPPKTIIKKSKKLSKSQYLFNIDNKYDENSSLGSRAYNKEQESWTLQESSNSSVNNSENYDNRDFVEI